MKRRTLPKKSGVVAGEVDLPAGATPSRTRLPRNMRPKIQAAPLKISIPDEVFKARDLLREQLMERIANDREVAIRERRLVGWENVGAITVGEKLHRGQRTGVPCIRVHVHQKKLPEHLSKDCTLPSECAGIPTDVIATGKIYAHQGTTFRPANGGCSMSFRGITRGTACCVVKMNAPALPGGVEFGFLGNNHTLAGLNSVATDDWIVQPSPADGGRFPESAIARLRKWVELNFDPDGWNEVDCAVAAARTMDCAGGVLGIGAIKKTPLDPIRGRQVVKVGAVTGVTYGVIDDPDVSDWVTYQEPQVRSARFRHLMKISPISLAPFSNHGDSGSLILDVQTLRPVGLLIGGDASFSYACRMSAVLSLLNVTIV